VTIPTKKRLIVVGLVLIGLIGAGTVPIPHTLKGPCVLEPSAVWYLSHDGAGQLITGWEHNLLESGGEHVLLQFDRPDFVEVTLTPKMLEGGFVQVGDTVAIVASSEGAGQQKILETELQRANMELNRLLAGERPEDIEVAKQAVLEAEVRKNALKPEFDRIKAQYESGAATLSQLQEIEGRFQGREAELRLANAELSALEAGARPEDITIAKVEIEGLRHSLESSNLMMARTRVVVAPISGMIRLGGNTGTMLFIERVDTLAVITALPEPSLLWLKEGQNLEIKLKSENSFTFSGYLDRIDFSKCSERGSYGGPVGITFLENHNGRLHSGMTGNTLLKTGNHTLLTMLQSRLQSR